MTETTTTAPPASILLLAHGAFDAGKGSTAAPSPLRALRIGCAFSVRERAPEPLHRAEAEVGEPEAAPDELQHHHAPRDQDAPDGPHLARG